MSFSADVKTELCRRDETQACCRVAQLYGALLFAHTFRPTEVRVVTGLPLLADTLSALLRAQTGFDFDEIRAPLGGKTSLRIVSPDKLVALRELFAYGETSGVTLHINQALLGDECCMAAFLRGAFLTGGTILNPLQTYHLELATTHQHVCREAVTLFYECRLNPKIMTRAGHHVLYFKSSESIEDFLTTIGATRHALQLMEIKVEKDVRNQINRKVNCDTANVAKTVEAVLTQSRTLQRLKESDAWDKLTPALRETAEMRLLYPEDSLTELAARFTPPLGRSGLNHRLRKLKQIAEEQ